MTIHSAKRLLEFPVVFVVVVRRRSFPNQMSIYDREDLEEERRLFYVAVTEQRNFVAFVRQIRGIDFGNLQFCDPVDLSLKRLVMFLQEI